MSDLIIGIVCSLGAVVMVGTLVIGAYGVGYEAGDADGYERGKRAVADAYRQCQWERDAAIEQLRDMGAEFGAAGGPDE